jgi:hypothetical protein
VHLKQKLQKGFHYKFLIKLYFLLIIIISCLQYQEQVKVSHGN